MNTTTKTPKITTLRAEAKAKGVTYYRQGSQWIRSAWSEKLKLNIIKPLHYSYDKATEKQMLLRELGYTE